MIHSCNDEAYMKEIEPIDEEHSNRIKELNTLLDLGTISSEEYSRERRKNADNWKKKLEMVWAKYHMNPQDFEGPGPDEQ